MVIFNHAVEYDVRRNEWLNENCVRLTVKYDDAFGERQSVIIPFNDSRSKTPFRLDRVKITGTAITGSRLRPAIVTAVHSRSRIEAWSNAHMGTYRWLDKEQAQVGDQVYLVESFHPITGDMAYVATTRKCQALGLMSMNIMILDESCDIERPIKIDRINLLTGDIYADGR